MKNIVSKLTIGLMLVVPFLGYTSAKAQQQEVSAQVGFGVSSLTYDVTNGSSKNRAGFNVGLGYTYFFSEKWGVVTGVDMSFYNGKTTVGNITSGYASVDNEGDKFEYRSAFTNYEETQKTIFLNIPVMGQFQHPIMESAKLYAQAGVKVGIPISGKFEAKDAAYTTTGYYPDYNIEIGNIPAQGFGTYNGKSVENDLDLKVSFALAAEVGLKWSLADKMSLYTGLYLDYGLTDVVKTESDKALVSYSSNQQPVYGSSSILTAQHLTSKGSYSSLADKVKPISFGLRLRFGFGL